MDFYFYKVFNLILQSAIFIFYLIDTVVDSFTYLRLTVERRKIVADDVSDGTS